MNVLTKEPTFSTDVSTKYNFSESDFSYGLPATCS